MRWKVGLEGERRGTVCVLHGVPRNRDPNQVVEENDC